MVSRAEHLKSKEIVAIKSLGESGGWRRLRFFWFLVKFFFFFCVFFFYVFFFLKGGFLMSQQLLLEDGDQPLFQKL